MSVALATGPPDLGTLSPLEERSYQVSWLSVSWFENLKLGGTYSLSPSHLLAIKIVPGMPWIIYTKLAALL